MFPLCVAAQLSSHTIQLPGSCGNFQKNQEKKGRKYRAKNSLKSAPKSTLEKDKKKL
jgi:hypothetical protein